MNTTQFSNDQSILQLLLESGLIDSKWLARRHSLRAESAEALARAYVEKLLPNEIPPNEYFDFRWLRLVHLHPAVAAADVLRHYIVNWRTHKLSPSRFFNVERYLAVNNDIFEAEEEPLGHFIRQGRFEDRRPVGFPDNEATVLKYRLAEAGLFSAAWYRAYYSDMRSHGDPMMHFVIHGESEGRQPNPYFDPAWYRSKWMNGSQSSPIFHYLDNGRYAGLDTSPFFSPERYFELSRQWIKPSDDALAHFLRNGASWIGEPAINIAKPRQIISVANNAKLTLDELQASLPMIPKYLWRDEDAAPAAAPVISPTFDADRLDIHWIVPDFSAGGGGHTNIFRMVKLLEMMGHRSTIWVSSRTTTKTGKTAREMILKDYTVVRAEVCYLDEATPEELAEVAGDVMIATDYTTVYSARNFKNFKRLFYFVQDFEPYFHPHGAQYLAAEQTYRQDLDCLCAGKWLETKMKEYGRWAVSFPLAADSRFYYPRTARPSNHVPRIAFYSRLFTARRVVEFGLMALAILHSRGVAFHADLLFGTSLGDTSQLPFSHTAHDIMDHTELGSLYRRCDLGLVFSATNYSLLPQEMMACELPVMELKTHGSELVFPAGSVALVEPDPYRIADEIERLLANPTLLDEQARIAKDCVSQLSWESAAKIVADGMTARLRDLGFEASAPPSSDLSAQPPVYASVVIPTYKGIPDLEVLLPRLLAQRAPWRFEIIVVDTDTGDNAREFVARYPGVRFHSIERSEFGHGKTRNLGASLASRKICRLPDPGRLSCRKYMVVRHGRDARCLSRCGRRIRPACRQTRCLSVYRA